MRLLLCLPLIVASFPLMLAILVVGILIRIFGIIIKCQLLKDFGLNVMYSVDQMFNTYLMGMPDETLSMRLWRARDSGREKWFVAPAIWFVDKLFHLLVGERGHIANSHTDITGSRELYSFIKDTKWHQ